VRVAAQAAGDGEDLHGLRPREEQLGRDGHLVGERRVAVGEGVVPVQAELSAVDGGSELQPEVGPLMYSFCSPTLPVAVTGRVVP